MGNEIKIEEIREEIIQSLRARSKAGDVQASIELTKIVDKLERERLISDHKSKIDGKLNILELAEYFGELGENFDVFEEFCDSTPLYSFGNDDDADNLEKIQVAYAKGCDKRNLEIKAIERHRRKTGAI